MDKTLFDKLAFWRKTKPQCQLGLFVDPNKVIVCQKSVAPECQKERLDTSVAGAHSLREDEQQFIHRCFDLKDNQWPVIFTQIVKHYGPAQLEIVLCNHYYQLISVDRPNVEPEEMTQALFWSIKDIISQNIHDVHIDHFQPPLANINKSNVVVVDKLWLTEIITAATDLGCEISGITIEELALSNLFPTHIQQARLVLCHRREQDLLLIVVKGGELYMQRHIRGFKRLYSLTEDELKQGVVDNLSLELQRSMDYFDSQLRQAPVTSIELLIEGQGGILAQLIGQNFNQPVNLITDDGTHGDIVAEKFSQLALAEFSRKMKSDTVLEAGA